MAKKTDMQKVPEQETAEARAAEEKKAAETAEAEAKGAQEAEEQAKAGAKAKAEAAAQAPELVGIEELASKNRLPSWQSAALNRLMGWGSGKKVTEKAYKDALERLKTRRIGG